MAALTEGRNTPEALGPDREGPVAAAETIFEGAMVMIDASGNLVRGKTATGLTGAGVAQARADNAAGAAGAIAARYRPGIFRLANSAGADEITAADIGKAAWAVDDQTVARTSAANTRSKAGVVDHVDAFGVWVHLDAALARLAQ
ncbi:MAG: hypothetical protein CVT80_00330 [Alphaproteobacteria bacterium HGW-Alphaproteobacteria-2]|nr:MAG: hypothetical protein CVT80_00330 [Alphaproteobacteria bacterium HGW-Alphaproteobacteria-2]